MLCQQLLLIGSVINAVYSQLGREFVLAFLENKVVNDEPLPRLYLSTDNPIPVNVTISVPLMTRTGSGMAPRQYPDVSISLAAGHAVHTMTYDLHMMATGTEDKGILVTATGDISLQAASITYMSSEAFLVLPVASLGTRHYVMTYLYKGTSALMQGPAELGIVAAYPRTHVEILLTSDQIDIGYAGYGVRRDGRRLLLTLDRFQTYQLQSFDDLTGTKVTTSRKAAVFSGAKWTSVSTQYLGDHLVEQMPPWEMWDKGFITVPLATRQAGDVIRILGGTNGTVVYVTAASTGKRSNVTLDEGHFHQLTVPSNENLLITSNHRVLVGQFSKSFHADGNRDSDPSMAVVPPLSTMQDKYLFSAPSHRSPDDDFQGLVNVLVYACATGGLDLDEEGISNQDLVSPWTVIPGTEFAYGAMRVRAGAHKLSHRQRVPFLAMAYGFRMQESYGFPLRLEKNIDIGSVWEYECPVIETTTPEVTTPMAGPQNDTLAPPTATAVEVNSYEYHAGELATTANGTTTVEALDVDTANETPTMKRVDDSQADGAPTVVPSDDGTAVSSLRRVAASSTVEAGTTESSGTDYSPVTPEIHVQVTSTALTRAVKGESFSFSAKTEESKVRATTAERLEVETPGSLAVTPLQRVIDEHTSGTHDQPMGATTAIVEDLTAANGYTERSTPMLLGELALSSRLSEDLHTQSVVADIITRGATKTITELTTAPAEYQTTRVEHGANPATASLAGADTLTEDVSDPSTRQPFESPSAPSTFLMPRRTITTSFPGVKKDEEWSGSTAGLSTGIRISAEETQTEMTTYKTTTDFLTEETSLLQNLTGIWNMSTVSEQVIPDGSTINTTVVMTTESIEAPYVSDSTPMEFNVTDERFDISSPPVWINTSPEQMQTNTEASTLQSTLKNKFETASLINTTLTEIEFTVEENNVSQRHSVMEISSEEPTTRSHTEAEDGTHVTGETLTLAQTDVSGTNTWPDEASTSALPVTGTERATNATVELSVRTRRRPTSAATYDDDDGDGASTSPSGISTTATNLTTSNSVSDSEVGDTLSSSFSTDDTLLLLPVCLLVGLPLLCAICCCCCAVSQKPNATSRGRRPAVFMRSIIPCLLPVRNTRTRVAPEPGHGQQPGTHAAKGPAGKALQKRIHSASLSYADPQVGRPWSGYSTTNTYLSSSMPSTAGTASTRFLLEHEILRNARIRSAKRAESSLAGSSKVNGASRMSVLGQNGLFSLSSFGVLNESNSASSVSSVSIVGASRGITFIGGEDTTGKNKGNSRRKRGKTGMNRVGVAQKNVSNRSKVNKVGPLDSSSTVNITASVDFHRTHEASELCRKPRQLWDSAENKNGTIDANERGTLGGRGTANLTNVDILWKDDTYGTLLANCTSHSSVSSKGDSWNTETHSGCRQCIRRGSSVQREPQTAEEATAVAAVAAHRPVPKRVSTWVFQAPRPRKSRKTQPMTSRSMPAQDSQAECARDATTARSSALKYTVEDDVQYS